MTELIDGNIAQKKVYKPRQSPEQTKLNTLKAKQRHNEFLKTVRRNRHLTPQQMVEQGIITEHEATLQGANVDKLIKYHRDYFVNNREHVMNTRLKGFKTCDLCGIQVNCTQMLHQHRNGSSCIRRQKENEEMNQNDTEPPLTKQKMCECDLCGAKLCSTRRLGLHQQSRRCIRQQKINEIIKEEIFKEERTNRINERLFNDRCIGSSTTHDEGTDNNFCV